MNTKNVDGGKKRIEQARHELTEKEYREYERLSVEERLRRKQAATNDQGLQAMYEEEIRKLREQQVTREAALAQDEENAVFYRERALEKGPTLWQRLKWKIAKIRNACALAKTISAHVLEKMGGFLVNNVGIVFSLTALLTLISIIAHSIGYGLGLNCLFYILFCLPPAIVGLNWFLAVYNIDHYDVVYRKKMEFPGRIAALVCSVLLILVGLSNLFWKNFTPQRCYVGVVVDKTNVVVRTIDTSNQAIMDVPRWWYDEKVVWYDIARQETLIKKNGDGTTSNIDRTAIPVDVLMTDTVVQEITVRDRKAMCTIVYRLTPRLEGFANLHRENKPLLEYRDDMGLQVTTLLHQIKTGDVNLQNMVNQISGLSNDLFAIKAVYGQIQYTETARVEK